MIKKILFLFFTIVSSRSNKNNTKNSRNINLGKDNTVRSRNINLSKNNTVSLTKAVDDESISTVIAELYRIHQNKNNANIYIYLDTPGGSVDAGNRLIETIEYLSHSNNISCVAHHAASMGFVILQSCPHRLGLKSSSLMQHQISTMMADEKQRLKTYMKYMDSLEDELISLQARRIKMSNQQFRDVTYHNWWLTGKQALKYNVVDELVVVGCDKSLLETTITANASIIPGSVAIYTNSLCPLIHKPVNIKYESI